MPNIGPLELGIVLLIVLLVFGPKKLPGLGKQLGSGMREFKDSLTGSGKDDDDRDDRPELTRAASTEPAVRVDGQPQPPVPAPVEAPVARDPQP
jgi:sec-independent protein translocase protein TatA